MSALAGVTHKRNSSVEQPRRRKISITQKRWLLSAHLLFMAAWLGGVFCSLALNIVALKATDPQLLNTVYTLSETLDVYVLRVGAAGSLLTGLLLAWLTQWGLLTFYWIIAKEITTILVVVLDNIIIRWNASAIALTATQASNPAILNIRNLLFIGILVRLMLLLTIIVISIFKPWGQRKRASQSKGEHLSPKVIVTDV